MRVPTFLRVRVTLENSVLATVIDAFTNVSSALPETEQDAESCDHIDLTTHVAQHNLDKAMTAALMCPDRLQ